MKYIISMDGGGSKTKFLLSTTNADCIDCITEGGCSYPHLGIDFVCNLIFESINQILLKNKVSYNDVACICLGIPCLGENPKQDELITNKLKEGLSIYTENIITVNDVELGFWAAQPNGNGIHIVAGTGAIAFARNDAGNTYRSNGWHNLLSDEGSGFWLGMKTISVFLKQFDGRERKTILYEKMLLYIKNKYKIEQPLDFISMFDEKLINDRKEIAEFQKVLLDASLHGDTIANNLYFEAAEELYKSILSLTKYFENTKPIITFSGGLFNVDILFKRLKLLLNSSGFDIKNPISSPEKGGIFMSLNYLSKIKK